MGGWVVLLWSKSFAVPPQYFSQFCRKSTSTIQSRGCGAKQVAQKKDKEQHVGDHEQSPLSADNDAVYEKQL